MCKCLPLVIDIIRIVRNRGRENWGIVGISFQFVFLANCFGVKSLKFHQMFSFGIHKPKSVYWKKNGDIHCRKHVLIVKICYEIYFNDIYSEFVGTNCEWPNYSAEVFMDGPGLVGFVLACRNLSYIFMTAHCTQENEMLLTNVK